MKNRLILGLSIILVVGVVVSGTFAYFSVSTNFENVFKLIHKPSETESIEVNLTEPQWDNVGKTLAKKTFPGMTIPKDPTITIATVSKPAYARYAVAITDNSGKIVTEKNSVTDKYIIDEILTITDITSTADVVRIDTDIANGIVYFNVQSIFDNDETQVGRIQSHVLFNEINIPTQWKQNDIDRYGNFHIKIIAQAIETGKFTDANTALKELTNPYSEI